MTNSKRILVITPSLNGGLYLEQCLDSVRNVCPSAVHIVVTPNMELLKARCSGRNVKVLKEEVSGRGMYEAINYALVHSEYDWEWFTYINDDDILCEGFSAIVDKCMVDSGDIYYGEIGVIDESGKQLGLIPVCRMPGINRFMWSSGKSALMQQGMVAHRRVFAALKGFDSRYRFAGDMDFFCRAEEARFRFRFLPSRVGAFRLRRGQLSAQVQLLKQEEDRARLVFSTRVSFSRWLVASMLMVLMNPKSYLLHLARFGVRKRREMYEQ